MTREEAIEKLEQLWNEVYNEDSDGYDYAKAIDMAIESLESEVRPVVRGEWIQDRLCSTRGGTYGVRRCSVCEHYFQDLVNEYNYCPNCGAKMGDIKL